MKITLSAYIVFRIFYASKN